MTTLIRIALAVFLVYFGFKISLADYKLGKISNIQIRLCFVVIAASVFLLFLVSAFKELLNLAPSQVQSPILNGFLSAGNFLFNPALAFKFYLDFLMHGALIVISGLIFWKAKIWPAGDGKLYIAFGIALPLIYPNLTQFPNRLFLVLLINIFVPASLFFVGSLFVRFALKLFSGRYDKTIKTIPGNIAKTLKGRLNKSPSEITGWLFLTANYFILFSISQVLRLYAHNYFVKIVSSPMIVFGVLFLTWDRIYGYMMRKRTTALFLIIMGVYLVSGSFMFPEKVKQDLINGMSLVLRFGMLVIFLKTFISHYFEKTQKFTLPVTEISAGMIPTRNTLNIIGRDKEFSDIYSDGLTPAQAEKIKKWDKSDTLEFARAKPFAMWIWLGSIITLMAKTDMFNFIKTSLPHFSSAVSKLMGYS